jgi:class 3 adenylate cyclase/tetratricopeptide (TPR) repeat protein
MQCPRCQHENPAGARFCGQCAASLASLCPSCGASNPPDNRFCGQCATPLAKPVQTRFVRPASYTPRHLAEKILTSKAALEGERKQVTVLFADLKSSMELLSDRDPEDARKILDPVLELMMEAVHRYEGTVNQVMGDGIMAIFGAPVAHEDHATRACYAALRLQEQIEVYAAGVRQREGLSVQVRIGINSGEVVVRSIGSDLHMDYTAVGQTTHLAARMEQVARPGSTLLTADSLRLAEGYVQVEPLGPIPVKGLTAPVEVYELRGASPVRSRFRASTTRGLTPFVGRDGEIRALRDGLTRAGEGQGQIVAVVGEPGVGKSRLLHEFVHSHHTAAWLVLESHTASYGRATPYLPLIELLRNYFKIEARDSTRSVREKVTGKILTLDPGLQDTIPPVLDLLDALYDDHPFASLDPLQHRQYTYEAITRLLSSEHRIQPVVVVFEDLHWNDSLTLGLLNELVAATEDARVLLLISYRPEYEDEWQTRPNYRQLRLAPLGGESVAELLQLLVGADSSLSGLKNLLLARAGGNPFFVEEIVQNLVDTGVLAGARGGYRLAKPFSSVQVPPTVQAVLAARIDGLPAAEKRLLQAAAVVGHDVPFALLHVISELAEDELRVRLDHLQTAEFLYATQLFPELQYTFKHSLTHDVAYSGLLHDRRRDIHARIVEALEKLYADRLGEQLERLAEHALRGQLWDKAVVYLQQAGAKAADRQAYREAVVLFEQALDALAHLPESRERLEQAIDLRFDIRNVLQPLGDRDRIAGYLGENERLAARLADPRRMGWVQSYLTEHFWILGRYEDAAAAGEKALAIAGQLSNLALQVVTNLPLGLTYHTQGDYRRAMEYFRWNAEHLEGDRARERFGMFVLPAPFSLSFVAWALAELGEFAEGAATGEEALRIAEAAEHPFSCGYAHLGLGVLFLRQGDVRRALRAFERALSAGAFAESPVGFSYVAFHLGYAHALAGRPDDGIPILEQTVTVAESKRFVARHALRLSYLGEAYLIAGRAGDAAAQAARALALAREHDERANQAYALRVLGEIDLHRGKPSDAEGHFRDALRLSQALGMRPLQAHCHRGIAAALDACGRDATAHRTAATTLIEALHMRFWGDRLVDAAGRG